MIPSNLFIKLVVLFAPIQSFVVTNVIKGLTISNILLVIIILKNIILLNKRFIFFTTYVLFIYLLYFFISQLSYILDLDLPNLDSIIFITNESVSELLIRTSFLNHSLYVITCIMFFYMLLQNFKKYGQKKIIEISFLSIFIFVLYGYYEFFGYILTGSSIDYISNRIFGEDGESGLFQTIDILGVNIQRIKSLSGEPSMFAFTILPFFVLSTYINKKIMAIFLFFTLLLSTSTTAILGIVIWLILYFYYSKNKIIVFLIMFFFLSVFIIFFGDLLYAIYNIVYEKLTLQNISGIERYSFFYEHLNAWYHSNIINFIFGYGFGYARSTDGLSTLLFNIGLLGMLLYVLFFIFPFFLIKNKTIFIKGLYASNLTLLLVVLISVPEFYYPHIWFFNALLWNEYLKEKNVNSKC